MNYSVNCALLVLIVMPFWGVSGLVRLVGGLHYYEGRVEVYKNGVWGTVCDDNWGYSDAEVVCRELGYSTSSAVAYSNAFYGQGSGTIWLTNVACYSWEATLLGCTSTTDNVGVTSCTHSEDASVSCLGEVGSSFGGTVDAAVGALSVGIKIAIAVGVIIPILIIICIVSCVVCALKKKTVQVIQGQPGGGAVVTTA